MRINPGTNRVAILLTEGLVQVITATDDELGYIHDALERNGVIRAEGFNGWINASNVVMVTFPEDEE